MEGSIVDGLKYAGAGLACIGMGGAAHSQKQWASSRSSLLCF